MKSEKNLNLKKNQEVSLTIEDFTKEGEGLGKYQGFPLFVKDTVIGDEVKVSITKLKKNYGYARLVEIKKSSEDRVTPLCPVARQCGGCKLQQISYDKQLHFKKGLVEGCLTRIGGFEKEDIEQKMEPVYGMGSSRIKSSDKIPFFIISYRKLCFIAVMPRFFHPIYRLHLLFYIFFFKTAYTGKNPFHCGKYRLCDSGKSNSSNR